MSESSDLLRDATQSDEIYVESVIEDLEDRVIVKDVEPGDGDEVKGSISVGSSSCEVLDSIPKGSKVDDANGGVRISARLAGKVPSDGLKRHTDFKEYG